MNKERRKELAALADRINEIMGEAEAIKADIETARDEEQDYLDNMPESMQNGEKGERAQEAIESMETAIEALDEFINADAIDALNTAQD